MRTFVDYEKLNEVTVGELYLLTMMDKCFVSLGKARLLSALDVGSRSRQIKVDECDPLKAAFMSHDEHFQFCENDLPPAKLTGDISASKKFHLIINEMVFSFLYLDNIAVFSKKFSKLLTQLWQGLTVL